MRKGRIAATSSRVTQARQRAVRRRDRAPMEAINSNAGARGKRYRSCREVTFWCAITRWRAKGKRIQAASSYRALWRARTQAGSRAAQASTRGRV